MRRLGCLAALIGVLAIRVGAAAPKASRAPRVNHRFTVYDQDPSLAAELDEAFRFVPSSPNRLQNGSFELGLGAEPFHPGWAPISLERGEPLPTFSPPGPVIDNTKAVDGKSSLRLTIPAGPYRTWLYITPPAALGPDTLHKLNFSAMASRGTVLAKVGMCTKRNAAVHTFRGDWKRCETSVVVANQNYKLMIELTQNEDKSKPTEVWIDAVQSLDVDTAVNIDEVPEVELNFLPDNRQGIHWAGKPFTIPVAGRCRSARTLDLAFYAKDVSRPGVIHKPWTAQVACQPGVVFNATISAPKQLPRGTYVGVLAARDAKDTSIVGTTQRYFSIMTNLAGKEPPEFWLGSLQGLRNWGNRVEFSWHGGWDADDHYKLMYQSGLRAHSVEAHWSELEPKDGEYNWFLDGDMEAAARNGCTHMIVQLGAPNYLTREQYAKPDPKAAYFGLPGWLVPRSTPVSSEDRHGAMAFPGNRETKVVLLPPTKKMVDLFSKMSARWKGKLDAVVSYAEINLFLQPEFYVDNVLAHIYGPLKAASPETKLLFGVSYDFDVTGKSYVKRVLDAGGTKFSDGVSTHNYGRPLIGAGGISAITGFAARVKGKTNKFGKPLVIGQTAAGDITSHTSYPWPLQHYGWDLAQRELTDVGAGARWSMGDSLYYSFWTVGMKNSMRDIRGPMLAPGQSAVANNAIYSLLAGAKAEGLIELSPDLMVATFSSSKHWFAALACTEKDNVWVLVDTSLQDLKDLEVYDLWGERIPFDGSLVVDKEPVYLKTTDRRLFSRLTSAKLRWGANAMAVALEGDHNDPMTQWKRAKTGTVDMQFGAAVASFEVLETTARPGTPVAEGIIDARGVPSPAAGTWTRIKPTYVASCIPMANPEAKLPGAIYAYGPLYCPSAASMDLLYSFAHISKAELWVNGVLAESWKLAENHRVGYEWLAKKVALSAGMNNLLLVLTPRGEGKPILRMRTWATKGRPENVRLTQAPGAQMVQTRLSGKGQLFNPEDMLRAPVKATWFTFRKGSYNLDFSFRDGHSYPLDSYEIKSVVGFWGDAPAEWKFYGSNDGTEWELVDSQSNLTWTASSTTRIFELKSKKSYAHYRWHLPDVGDPHSKVLRRIRYIHLRCKRESAEKFISVTRSPKRP